MNNILGRQVIKLATISRGFNGKDADVASLEKIEAWGLVRDLPTFAGKDNEVILAEDSPPLYLRSAGIENRFSLVVIRDGAERVLADVSLLGRSSVDNGRLTWECRENDGRKYFITTGS